MFQKLNRFQTFHMLRGNHLDKARWTLWGVHPIFELKQLADNHTALAARFINSQSAGGPYLQAADLDLKTFKRQKY